MIRYKENPSFTRLKVVKTFTGELEYRNNCKYIKEEYYIINQDCFFINNQWYRINSDKIGFDISTNEWRLKKELKEGIIGWDEKIDAPIIGYFSISDIYYSIVDNHYCTYKGNDYSCIDYRILQENGFVEQVRYGNWYYAKDLQANQISNLGIIANNPNFDRLRQGYNIEDNKEEYPQRIEAYNNFPTVLSKDVRRYAKFLKNLKFGFEFETSKGYIPPYKLNQLGLVPLRDGSIGGAEYTTIPLEGAKGLQTIKDSCQELTKKCEIDINCSLHVHIGNIPTDRSFMVALYMLFYKIQDDLFSMFPYYKTDPKGIKQKNYCQKLKKLSMHPIKDKSKEGYKDYINTCYNKLFMLLSEGYAADKQFNKKNALHPITLKYERKHSRYFGLNMQNMIFSPRRTAEFRIASATTNVTKTTNWLFINAAIIQYAEANVKKIITCDKISLEEVLNIYKEQNNNAHAALLSDYLVAYFKSQQAIFKKDLLNGDVLSSHDITKDKVFTFEFGNVKSLF